MDGRHPGTGDGDERDRVGGDPVAVALERYQVMVVEVDLDVITARPVSPDHGRGGYALGREQARERLADQWVNGAAGPVGPVPPLPVEQG